MARISRDDLPCLLLQRVGRVVFKHEDVLPEYFFLWLHSPAFTTIIDPGRSNGVPHISAREIEAIPFSLPPLVEQRRIVGKVDQLLGLCDELAARQAARREARSALVGATLDRLVSARSAAEFPAHAHRLRDHFDRLFDTPTTLPKLPKLRQAIVNLAAHGQLVPQLHDELPATEMLKANRERHRSHWEQLELQRFEQQGKVPRSDAWKRAYPEPTPASDEGLPAIPSTWGWERIGLLGDDLFNAVQTGPFGSQLLKTEFVKSGVPVIAVGNLTGLGFTTDKLYFITSEKAAALARYDVQAGDVLFARSGATLGKVCVAHEYIQNWRMTGHILRARLNPSVTVPELFVLFLWGASFVTEQVTGGIRGMTRPGFNTGLLERIVLPVPPLSEQKRIVSKVTELLSAAETLATRPRPRHLSKEQWQTFQRLANEGMAALESAGSKDELRQVLATVRNSQNVVKHIHWNNVRMIECGELWQIELALQCLLQVGDPSRVAYEAARRHAE